MYIISHYVQFAGSYSCSCEVDTDCVCFVMGERLSSSRSDRTRSLQTQEAEMNVKICRFSKDKVAQKDP